MMLQYYGTETGTLSDAIKNYLVNVCNICETEIQEFQRIMLETGLKI